MERAKRDVSTLQRGLQEVQPANDEETENKQKGLGEETGLQNPLQDGELLDVQPTRLET